MLAAAVIAFATASACPSRQLFVPDDLRAVRMHFATYGNAEFLHSKQRISREAESTGWFDTVRAFGPEDLSEGFVRQHLGILSFKRGGGYWIWKLDILDQMLGSINEGDILVYADSGCRINPGGASNLWVYADKLSRSPHGMLSFELPYPERTFTNDAVFSAFNLTGGDADIAGSPQLMATVMMIQKGPQQRRWLGLVGRAIEQDPWIITDRYNRLTRHRSFRENRHDQSVFSVSRKIVGTVVVPDSTYPPNQCDMPFWASRSRS